MSWELKHSVVANADRGTAWRFLTDITNITRLQGESGESVTLDGPYQAGTRGTTKMRGQEPRHWTLAEVLPPERTVTEIELPGAVVRITWTFEEIAGDRTRLSQHMTLEGPDAETYVPIM